MFHVAAWGQALNPGGIFVSINAAQEPELRSDGPDLKIDARMPYIVGHAALINSATAERAALQAPSLEDVGGINIEPVCLDGQFGAPPEITMFGLSPVRLEPTEFVRAFVQSTPGGSVRHFVLAWFSDGILLPLHEPSFTVAASATIAQQNFRWMSGPITFGQTLPVGRYVVLGMRCRALSGIAARLIFRSQLGRPGAPLISAVTEPDDERFRRGNLGVWGSFLQEDPPLLDVYHGTAVAQDILLDLVRF